MSENKNKKLANLIKAELWDILKNESRWGEGLYFFEYEVIGGKIWTKEWEEKFEISEEVKKLVKENAQVNHNRRKKIHDEAIAKEKKEWESKHKKPLGPFPFKLDEQEIWPEELEKEDYNEIVSLINQIKEAKLARFRTQIRARNQKINDSPNLFYWGGGKRWDGSTFGFPKWASSRWQSLNDKHYCSFLKKQVDNPNESRSLEINPNHPVLDNFPFEKAGFYIIKGIESLPWEASPTNGTPSSSQNWFWKFVKPGDNITITPYEFENDGELSETEKKELETKRKSECDTCHKKLGREHGGSDNFYIMKRYRGGEWENGGKVLWACQDCYPIKEQEYLQNYSAVYEGFTKDRDRDYRLIKAEWIDCYAGKKDQNGKILKQRNCSHCQPWKKFETPNSNKNKTDIKSLIKYFQDHQIKKIKLKNGELIITHNNNNKTLSTKEVDNDQELQLIKDLVKKSNNQELTAKELEKKVNNDLNSSSTTPNNNKLWIGIGIGGILILGATIITLTVRKNKKVKK